MKSSLRFILFSSLLISLTLSSFVIESVDRTVKLQSQVAEVKMNMRLKNTGQTSLSSFHLIYNDEDQKDLIFLQVLFGEKSQELKVNKLYHRQNFTWYEVQFNQPLAANAHSQFIVIENYFGKMKALPKAIKMFDDQYMVYSDNAFLNSPYAVHKQRTTYKLNSPPLYLIVK